MRFRCNRYRNLIMRYFDRTLNREENNLLKEHTDGCSNCRTLFDDLQRIMEGLEKTVQLDPDPELETLVMTRIHSLPETGNGKQGGFIIALYGSLCLAALLLAASLPTLILPGTGILDLISRGVRDLYSYVEMARIARFIYEVLALFFSQTVSDVVKAAYNDFIFACFAAASMVIGYFLRPDWGLKEMNK